MTIAAAASLARETLSEKRFVHTKNVAAAARRLALRYGADPCAAELAGWLHDIVKERTREELLQLAACDDIIAKSVAARPQSVWHGPCGALYAAGTLGVTDTEVLHAIACHTTGCVDMSLLDKVLFLADVVSAERSSEGAKRVRRLVRRDMNAALIAAMEENIAYLRAKGKVLDEDTLLALRVLQRGSAPQA